MEQKTFHEKLSNKIETFIHQSYDIANQFPKEELYGAGSQLKRAALSIGLNTTEGYARSSSKSYRHFLLIAYGSLKESLYVINFSSKRSWITTKQSQDLLDKGDELGKMLWSIISKL
jgi:four helix bundle protein